MNSQRPPRVLHCTSEPLLFFGRRDELALLDRAVFDGGPSLIALVGPGGQGKTAIVQHWLHQAHPPLAGLFFWSFYRGKNVDQCLRELLAYAERLPTLPEVSGSWCVDRLLPLLRRERWAVVLDGAEVVQYEDGPWRGRFVHPDLGRLLEELASEPMPGAVILTTRFDVPTLIRRPYCRIVSLAQLDCRQRALLAGLGVAGSQEQLDAAAGRRDGACQGSRTARHAARQLPPRRCRRAGCGARRDPEPAPTRRRASPACSPPTSGRYRWSSRTCWR
ncbi:MAG: ATP-binding protein [Gemmataceae bacterium]